MNKELLKNDLTEEEECNLEEIKFEELKAKNNYCGIVDLVNQYSDLEIEDIVQAVVNNLKFWDIVSLGL